MDQEVLQEIIEDACRAGYKTCEAGESLEHALEAMQLEGSK